MIQFVKPKHDYDYFADAANFTGNCGLACVGGIAVTVVSDVALRSLGYHPMSNPLLLISTTAALLGGIGVVFGAGITGIIAYQVISQRR